MPHMEFLTRTQSGAGSGGSGNCARRRQDVGAKYAPRHTCARARVSAMRERETSRTMVFIQGWRDVRTKCLYDAVTESGFGESAVKIARRCKITWCVRVYNDLHGSRDD